MWQLAAAVWYAFYIFGVLKFTLFIMVAHKNQ